MNGGQHRAVHRSLNSLNILSCSFILPIPPTYLISSLSLLHTHTHTHTNACAHMHTSQQHSQSLSSLPAAAACLHTSTERKEWPGPLGRGQADLSNRSTIAILLRSWPRAPPSSLPAPPTLRPHLPVAGGHYATFKSDSE